MENFYKPDMSPKELETVVGEIFLSGIDRDIMSGLNASVYVLTENELKVVDLKTKKI